MPYEAVIGLEVHVQLRTETKLFCRCPHQFGAEPNTLVCPICLGYPGTLPRLNQRAVVLAVRLALALGARVMALSSFDRKSYFYPDLAKGYQITQHRRPLARGGGLPLALQPRHIGIERLHLEEDSGKLVHEAPEGKLPPKGSLVDFNRSGAPLAEIVTRPELATPGEARDFLQTLQRALRVTATSDANMEEGSLRCDANVSVRRRGATDLGARVEIKNLSSFRHLTRALEHEIRRQEGRLEEGLSVARETRGFDAALARTRPLRGKEGSRDYRYLPEPDVPPITLSEDRLQEIRSHLPEMPWALRERLEERYDLSARSAGTLSRSPELAAYFEAVLDHGEVHPGTAASWILNQLLGELHRRGAEVADAPPPRCFAELLRQVDEGAVSTRGAKQVLAEMWGSTVDPTTVIERLGLTQARNPAQLHRWIDDVLASHPREVERYRQGEDRLLGFFIGRVMDRSQGRAAPKTVQTLLRRALTDTVISTS